MKKNKERLRNEGCERYQNLSEGERSKKENEAHECHKNLSEDEKQRIAERRSYYTAPIK